MVDPKKASELANVYTASDLVDADIRFGVDDAVNELSAQLSLAELKKTANVVTTANVAALYALTYAIDNQLYQTLGYTTEGIGANLYRYDSGSSATPDDGFILDGIGGDGTGTGTGRFIAVDKTVARPEHFGAKKHSTYVTPIFAVPESGTSSIGAGFDSTVAIQRCMDAAAANEVNVLFEPGLYFITATIDLPTSSAWTATSSTLHPVMKISGYGAEIRSNFDGEIFSHVPIVGEEDETGNYWTLQIEGFHFMGPYDFESAPLKTSSIGVYYDRGYTCAITDCRFSNLYIGIWQKFVIHGIVDSCRFDGCSIGTKVAEGYGTNAHVTKCRFYGEDPEGVAYWFADSTGVLEHCICEGFRAKYAIRCGSDTVRAGIVAVREFWLECEVQYIFKLRLHQYFSFDCDGLTVGGKGSFLDTTDSHARVYCRFRRVYAPTAYITIGATAWTATSFDKYDRVSYSGTRYIANDTCAAGDVPGVSGKWTSEGTYVVFKYDSTLNTDGYDFLDSQTVPARTTWLDATKWSDGVLPRHIRYESQSGDGDFFGHQRVVGYWHHLLTENSATPNVEWSDFVRTANTSATVITDFVDRASIFDAGPWRELTVFINDEYTTIQHDLTKICLRDGRDFSPGTNKAAIKFLSVKNVWYEVGRTEYGRLEANTAGSGSPNVLANSESGKLLTNEGTTAANYHTLPTAVAGLTYTFVVQDADGLRVTANTGDTIRLGSKVTAGAGYIESTTIGDYVTVTAINDTEWIGVAYGTWTNGTWTFTVVTST